MIYDTPRAAWYSERQAHRTGQYLVCRLAGSGHIVHATHLPGHPAAHSRPQMGDGVPLSLGGVSEVIAVINVRGVSGTPNPDFLPHSQAYATAIMAEVAAARQQVSEAEAAAVIPAPRDQPMPTVQSTLIRPLPYGVVISPYSLRDILTNWSNVMIPGWGPTIARLRELIPHNDGNDVVLVNDTAATGDGFLPPLPLGFRAERLFIRGWRVTCSSDINGHTICHVRDGTTRRLHECISNGVPGVTDIEDTFNNCWLRLSAGFDASIANWSLASLDVTAQITVIHLGCFAARVEPGPETVRSIYTAQPRPAEPVEDDEVDAFSTPTPAPPRTDEERSIAIERLFEGIQQPRETVRHRQRRTELVNSSERSNAGRRISAADRDLATRHGLIDWGDPTWIVGERELPVSDLEDRDIWNAVSYCVRNRALLCRFYRNRNEDIVAADVWLNAQLLYRRLLQQVVHRELTLPEDVFEFIAESGALGDDMPEYDGTNPWKDEELDARQRAIRERLRRPDDEDTRPNRRLDIDE